MHGLDHELEALVLGYVRARLRGDPPLAAPVPASELPGATITPSGIGAERALRVFVEALAPACVNATHPRFLAFVPHAPTPAATLFDLVVSAEGILADWWLEGAGAIHAENEALRWIAGLLGWPAGAGGVFLSGGTIANLNALFVARTVRGRGAVAIGAGGHASLRLAARVIDADVLDVPVDARGRMTGDALEAAVRASHAPVFAVAATAGTTNAGAVDDLAGIAAVARRRGLWMHVDGAYGGAALAAASARPLFAGVERADSFVVDPHKWLFGPLDCAALVYRDATVARAANRQEGEYLETVLERGERNPSDMAVHLTRRARGLPFWFSLASHGSDAYAEAIERCLALARAAAELIRAASHLELVLEPELSVVLFRRVGWGPSEHRAWSERALADGLTATMPTRWRGETVLRFCFVNPRTTVDDVRRILDALR